MTTRGVLARLLADPRRFGFDAAVRLLLHAAGSAEALRAVRFRSPPGLGFPASEVTAAEARHDPERPPVLSVTVMGLSGATGVLPRFYAEMLATSLRHRSRAMQDFFDLLAQRAIALFALAGMKYRPHRAAEHAHLAGAHTDPLGSALLALTGHGTPGLVDRLAAGSAPLQHYAGFFAGGPRSADRLGAMLSDWLGRPVAVEQFAGAWLALPPDQRTALPRGAMAGAWNRLGVDAAIGIRAWDVQGRIILRIGPLDRTAFLALLPDRPLLRRLVSVTRSYLGLETGFAVNPVLAGPAVPALQLASAREAPRLGWTTWLPLSAHPGARPRGDAADARFEADMAEGAWAQRDGARADERRAA